MARVSRAALSVLFLLGVGASVFLSVSLFRVSSQTGDRVLSVAWPLNALCLWLAAGALLSWAGGVSSGVLQALFGTVCGLSGFLAFLCMTASLSGQPPLPLAATLAHAAICLAVLVVFQLFHRVDSKAPSWPAALSVPLLLSALVLLAGMTTQNVAFASRFDGPLELTKINGTELFVSCAGNGTVMVLIVGDVDQASVYYMPLQSALTSQGFTACVYDSAGVGFSEPGEFPRSPDVLGQEASAIVDYLMAAYNATTGLFVVGCGHGGIVARLMLIEQYDNVNGIVLVDSLSEWDPQKLGEALGESRGAYIEALTAPRIADFKWQHVTAPVGLCLLNPFIATENFPALPSQFSQQQIQARCNGGSMAAASQSQTAHMYLGLESLPSSLGDLPLLVCSSAGAFSQPVIGQTLFQLQFMLSKISTSSTFQPFLNSQQSGDLVVLHIPELLSFLAPFLNSNIGNKK